MRSALLTILSFQCFFLSLLNKNFYKVMQFFAHVTAAEIVYIYKMLVGFLRSAHNFIEISFSRSLLALEFEKANF